MRQATLSRKTAETDINLTLKLDGKGEAVISTGVGFLDHMLTLFSRHMNASLEVSCKGDVFVDAHHTTEDVGIVLGKCLAEALGDKKGISRYGSITLPMDEALILSCVDISGRGALYYDVEGLNSKVGDFDTELCEEFWRAFVRKANITLHIRQLAGTNSHHIIEGIFKSVARSLGEAVSVDPRFSDDIPSTKGVL
jgi:imidazoleglycerol-phosphate dehydratase